ncbi:hypothetical protein T261_6890 [Streptomyces lydicus]|nr:hypothetical protein T261_6890 [Streptomyces lydicus]
MARRHERTVRRGEEGEEARRAGGGARARCHGDHGSHGGHGVILADARSGGEAADVPDAPIAQRAE